MSKRSLKKQDGNSNVEDSAEEEEDEQAMQAAMQAMVRMAEMDDVPRRKTLRSEAKTAAKEVEISKNQVSQGTQSIKYPKKTKVSKPETSILMKGFSGLGSQTTAEVPPQKGNQSKSTSPEQDKLSKKDLPNKDVEENRQVFKSKTVKEKQSPPGSSGEALLHTERYVSDPNSSSESKIEPIQVQDSKLGNEQLSEQFLQKLEKIEEASKPKSWVRPKPIVIRSNLIPSTANNNESKMEPKPHEGTEKKRGNINILKAPLQRSLNYATEKYEGKLAENPKENKAENPKENKGEDPKAAENPKTSTGEREYTAGNPRDNITESPREITAERSDKPEGNTAKPPTAAASSENLLEKPLEHHESQKTLTITGHRHITTKLGDHCHFEDRQEGVDKGARRNLIIACILCFTFMMVEIAGGYISNSLAIATDAAHLLTDLAAFLISLFALYLSGRPSSQRLNFGWYRAEVIGAMISVYLIWVITGILVYMAVQRLIKKDHDLDAKIMLITSALAILFNIIMACQLHHGHSHFQPSRTKIMGSHHGSGSGSLTLSTHFPVRSEQNINVRAALVHVIGDLVQSVGVFVAALIIFFKPEWSFMDSICTFLFSILVLAVTIKILKDVLMVLMEATPKYMDYDEVKRAFLSIDGVMHVHNLRIWALSINKVALSAHLAIAQNADPLRILEEAASLIHRKHNIFETTIQIEEYSSGMLDCNQCADPLKKKRTSNPVDTEEGPAVEILKKTEEKTKDPEKG